MTVDSEFAADVCSTLEAASEMVQNAATVRSTPPPSREMAIAVAEGLKREAAKVGLMFSQAEGPGRDAAHALLADLRDQTTALCLLWVGAASGASPTLRKVLANAAAAMVDSVAALVRSAVHEKRSAAVVQLAGICIERCDAALKVPLDDKTAIGRALATQARQIADGVSEMGDAATLDEDDEENEGASGVIILKHAIITAPIPTDQGEAGSRGNSGAVVQEFERLVEEWTNNYNSIRGGGGDSSKSVVAVGRCVVVGNQKLVINIVASKGANLPVGEALELRSFSEGGSGGGGDAPQVDATCEPVGEDEGMPAVTAVLLAAQAVLGYAGQVVQAAMRALMTAPLDLNGEVETWESLLWNTKNLGKAADDLGAGAYPPHDHEELLGAIASVVTSCDLMVEEAPGGLGGGAVAAVEGAERAGRQMAKLLDIIST